VKRVVSPMPVPGGMGHIGMFLDPSGNCIGLHKF
jgi:predicted enzyme related to lactoylglutathione lyase